MSIYPKKSLEMDSEDVKDDFYNFKNQGFLINPEDIEKIVHAHEKNPPIPTNAWTDYIESFLVNFQLQDGTIVYGACDQAAIIGPEHLIYASTDNFFINRDVTIIVPKIDRSGIQDPEKALKNYNELDHLIDCVVNEGKKDKMKFKFDIYFDERKWNPNPERFFEGKDKKYKVMHFDMDYTNEFGEIPPDFEIKIRGGLAVSVCYNGFVVIGTWTTESNCIRYKDEDPIQIPQCIGFCLDGIECTSKMLTSI